MADEAGEVNTAVEDTDAKQQQDEPQVSGAATDGEAGDSDAQSPAEKPSPAAAESTWSAPILSLARKATETISSGVSYAAAPRKSTQGSAASSPTEKEPENHVSNTCKKLPGMLWLLWAVVTQTERCALNQSKVKTQQPQSIYMTSSYGCCQLSRHMTA